MNHHSEDECLSMTFRMAASNIDDYTKWDPRLTDILGNDESYHVIVWS